MSTRSHLRPPQAASTAARRRAALRRRPRVSRLLAWLLAAWLGHAGLALAQVAPGTLPSGGQVITGSGTLQHSGNLLLIQQNSNRLGLDWQSFNIGSGATVEFRQPGVGSVALNRVLSNTGTEIYGRLKANGQVFLTNPNGVLFAPGASVDVGGLVASTLDLAQADFAAGRFAFKAVGGSGSVVNQGSLRASHGGYLALFGNQVLNQGDIAVDAGSVILASGRAATVSISGSGLISAVVDPALVQGNVTNSGRIAADGGVVTMNAKSAQDVAASLVNNTGIVRANAMVERGGEIWITGDQVATSGQLSATAPAGGTGGRIMVIGDLKHGSAQVSGQLDASAGTGGTGGFVETSGARVQVADGTRVSTQARGGQGGTWLIDPVDFTVAASGGDITGATLSANLTGSGGVPGNNVTIQSSSGSTGQAGNVNVNDSVSWSANKLTLNAFNDININSPLTASGTASLALEYGQGTTTGTGSTYNVLAAVNLPAGANFSTKAGSSGSVIGYTVITALTTADPLVVALQDIGVKAAAPLTGNYALGVDLSSVPLPGDPGFDPIGNQASTAANTTNSFSGRFDGLGHQISGLTISRGPGANASNSTGLFASTYNATISNLTLTGGSVAGTQNVGAVVGTAGGTAAVGTTLIRVSSSATVSGVDDSNSGVAVGGLVGSVVNGAPASGIYDSRSSGSVSGTSTVTGSSQGGIVGAFNSNGSIARVTSSGAVSGRGDLGGIVGYASGTGGLVDAVASSSVTAASGSDSVGGIAGEFRLTGGIINAQASGLVDGGAYVGGVVGYYNSAVALVTDATKTIAYTGASVTGTTWVGGIVGQSFGTAAITGVTSNANVSSSNNAGGLAGYTGGAVSNARATGNVSGAASGNIGGLIGQAAGAGGVVNSTATGSVNNAALGAAGPVGGLIGNYGNTGATSGNRAEGAVSGGSNTGGLYGYYNSPAAITDGTYTQSAISGLNNVGGLIGYMNQGSISGASAANPLTVAVDVTSAGNAGGLVGRSAGAVSNVTSTGKVTGGNNSSAGGVIGVASTGVLSNLRATGDVSVGRTSNIGGLVGWTQGNSSLRDSIASGRITALSNDGSIGGLVGYYGSSGTLSGNRAEGQVSGGYHTGGLIGFYDSTAPITDGVYTPTSISGGTWVGGLIGYMNQGSSITGASAQNPLTVAIDVTATGSAGGLVGRSVGAVSNVRSTGKVTGAGNSNIGGLIGQADGSGGLSNATATGNVTGATNNGSVGGLVGAYQNSGATSGNRAEGVVAGGSNTGGLYGYYNSTGAITDSTFTQPSISGGTWVGGLIGYMNQAAAITGPSAANPWTVAVDVTATVGNGAAGGFVGRSSGAMSNLKATGKVSGTYNVGGLVGYATGNGSISNSSATGNVSSSSTAGGSVGGLVGAYELSGAQTGNSASGVLSGGNATGGLIGWYNSAAPITDGSYTQASITGGQWVGGLIGYMNQAASISGASAADPWVMATNVTATASGGGAGGFAGRSFGSLGNLRATGTVVGAAGSNVGGISGQATGATGATMSNLSATGNVSAGGNSSVGGLIGYANGTGTLSNGAASGNVSVPSINDSSVGGLVGNYNLSGAISGSSASGVLSGGYNAGGLVGYYNSPATLADGSYGQASISGGSFVGGLVGQMNQGAIVGPSSGTPWVVATNVTATGNSGFPAAGGVVGRSIGPVANISATGNVQGNYDVGGLIGRAEGTGTLTNTAASGNVTSTTTAQASVGGLVGAYNLTGSQTGNSASGVLTGGSVTGGLIGYYNSTAPITDGTYTQASITGGAWVGGLIGYMNQAASISGPSAANPWVIATNVTATVNGGGAGVFAGRSFGSLANLKATGTVTANVNSTQVGGLVGRASGSTGTTLGNLSATGTVTSNSGSSLNVGGLIGWADGTGALASSSATGNVVTPTNAGSVGGLVGAYEFSGATSGNSAAGVVTGGYNTGGLYGYYNSPAAITDGTYSQPSITGGSFVGGIVGQMVNGSIRGPSAANPWTIATDVTSTASWNGQYPAAGGFVGRSYGSVANLKSTGNIEGKWDVGGIVGAAIGTGTFTDNTATGNVTSSITSGGSIGGLAGAYQLTGAMSRNSASGVLTGGNASGGLVGYYDSTAPISDGTYTQASITGGQWVGGLIGYMNRAASISGPSAANPWVIATNVTATVNGGGAGGVVGRSLGSMANLQATGDVRGIQDAGGVVGRAEGTGTMSAVSATGNVTTNTNNGGAGGVVGSYNLTGAITGASASGTVSGGNSTGGLIGYYNSTATISDGSVTSTTVTGGRWVGGLVGYMNQAAAIAGPSAANPLTVAVNVIGSGQSGGFGGLVGFSNGPVSNVRATGNVSGSGDYSSTGGLIGWAVGTGAITNSSATGNVTASNSYSNGSGGLAGSYSLSASQTGNSASGTVTGGFYAGGLIGWYDTAAAITSGNAATNAVSGTTWVGGLVGYMNTAAAITGASAANPLTVAASVTATGNAGGVAGRSSGAVSNVLATGAVTGTGNVGGLVGQAEGTGSLSGSVATGRVIGGSSTGNVGGLVGAFSLSAGQSGNRADGLVSGGSNTGGLFGLYSSSAAIVDGSYTATSISGGTWVGGLVGYINSAAAIGGASANAPLLAAADVTATGNAGGLAGRVAGNVAFAIASGAVSGNGTVGGLIAQIDGSGAVSASSASGKVSNSSTNYYTGGLIGYASGGGVTGSTASGDVSGGRYVGGLIGQFYSNGNIQNTVATGKVSGSYDTGGLIGYAYGSGSLSDSRAAGNVNSSTGGGSAGGLVGYFNLTAGQVRNRAEGTVSGSANAGGFIGQYDSAAAITDGTVTGASVSGGSSWAGGFVGYMGSGASISGVSVSNAVTGSYVAGGLAGRTAGSVTNSSASGNVSASYRVGGLIGQAQGSGTITDSTASGTVTRTGTGSASSYGGLVGYLNGPGVLRGTATGSVTADGGYAGGLVGYQDGNGSIAASRAEGAVSGTTTAGGLAGYTSGSGSITGSIALGNVSTPTTTSGSVGGLVGEFRMSGGIAGSEADGTVSGGYYTGGLVGYSYTTGAIATSLVKGASVSGGTWVGGLLGYGEVAGTISGITVSMPVTATGSAGGLAGRVAGNVSGSSASGAVTGAGSVGGLIGEVQGSATVTGSSASGRVTNTSGSSGYAGGLIGYASGAGVGNNTATGNVSGSRYTGGLIGLFNTSGNVQNNSASGTVSGNYDVGGLIGYAQGSGSLTDNTATGSATGVIGNASVGGLVGYFSMTAGQARNSAAGVVNGGAYSGGLIGYYTPSAAITDGTASGASVTGGVYTGGLIGYSQASAISGVSSAATVIGTGYTGGLAGISLGPVSNSSASGNVTGTGAGGYAVGGLIGLAQGTGTLTDVSASGIVSGGSGAYTGGLVGYTNGPGILRGTATGAVSGGTNVGGLVGYISNNADVRNASASGNVSGSNDVGGLVGYASGNGGIFDSTASGRVSNSTTGGDIGGLVGTFYKSGGMARVSASGIVSGGSNAGGLVGIYSSNGALTDAAYTGTSVTGNSAAGGLIGNAGTITLSKGSSAAKVSANSYAGGLVGYGSSSGSISSSTTSGDVTGSSYAGGLAGRLDGISISDSTASGKVTAIADTVYAGGLVGQFNYYSSSNTFISGSRATGNVTTDSRSAWVGGLVGNFASGSISGSSATGTVNALDSSSGSSGNHYAGGLVGYFGGTSIGTSTASGTVAGRYYAGGLVGSFSGTSILGSTASGAVSGTNSTGGLVGSFSGSTIADSGASGSVSGGSAYAGGLAGYAYSSAALSNVSATGAVSVASNSGGVGGLVGYKQGAGIINGFASGKVTVGTGAASVGGLVGYIYTYQGTNATASINDSAATGDVSGGTTTGGLVGYYQTYANSGGIVNSHAAGNVTGSTYTGGLVGQFNGGSSSADDIRNSYATGAVSGTTFAGGLAGYFYGAKGVSGSYATGAVQGRGNNNTQYLGGLVGYYYHLNSTGSGVLTTSYATGNVSLDAAATLATSTGIYGGGLVGYLNSTGGAAAVALTDAYATGSVTIANANGQLRAGGLVGNTDASITRAYSSGAVTVTGGTARFVGGLVGQRPGQTTISNSYWDQTSSGQATSQGGTGLGSGQMKQAASFATWSLATDGTGSTTWRIYEGNTRPLLRNFLTPLTLTLADASKTYDGTVSFGNAQLAGTSGTISNPERIFTTLTSPDVGVYAVSAGSVYSVQSGYDLTVSGSAMLTVTPRPLTLAGVIADKVYDGTRSATVSGTAQPTGLVAGEDLLIDIGNVSAVFDTKNVGTNKTVTVSGYTLADGVHGKASNYSIGAGTNTNASITPATLTAGGFSATNRAYDGSTLVVVTATTGSSVSGVIGTDDVRVDLAGVSSGTVANKNVGTGKPVTVSGVALSGTDAGNYVVGGVDGVKVDITPKAVTVNSLAAVNRTYNAGTSVQVQTGNGVISGLVANDIVEVASTTLTGSMTDKNVGIAKPVTLSGVTLRGPDAANYMAVAGPVSVNITPATVYLYPNPTGAAISRVYDGTAGVSISANLQSRQGNDDLTLSYDTPTFADKNVAYNSSGTVVSKPISFNNALLGGADKGNYVLDTTYYSYRSYGTITPKPIAVTGISAIDRVYNGTRDVSVNVAGATVDLTALIMGDLVAVTVPSSGIVAGTIASKNAGTALPVMVDGLVITGADKGNYTLSGTTGVTVNIARLGITASYTGIDKVYDGSANAAVRVSATGILSGDQVLFYADAGYCGGGCGFAYFATPNSTPANYTLSKDAGTGKTVIVNGNAFTSYYGNGLYGSDGANYTVLNPTATVTASITPKALSSLAFTGTNKVYDGTTAATVTLNRGGSGIFGGDSVTSTQVAEFTGSGAKNVGNAKPIAVSNVVLGGSDAGNYTLASTSATTSANITQKPVTFTGITGIDRAYDGSATVAVNASGVTSSGFVTGDQVVVQQPAGGLSSGTVANKNVGQNKVVTVTGLTLAGTTLGDDSGNYRIDSAGSGITVTITPKPLTASYVGVNRTYNGGVTAQVSGSSVDLVGGDSVGFQQSAVFTGIDARNAGSNKPISITGISLTGDDRANYALLNTTAAASADISAKGLTVLYSANNRVYSGLADTSVTVTGSSGDLVAGDLVAFSQTARLRGDGAAGDSKAVDITGITLTGAQAANYALTTNAATTTVNIARRPIGVTGITATDRAYDGSTVVAINVGNASINTAAVIGGDDVQVAVPPTGISTGTMTTKDVGQAKAVQVTGLGISGASAANYVISGAAGLTVNISPRSLTALYTAAGKVYDGTAAALVTASSSDILAGDIGALGISASGAFSAGKNAGTDKVVAVSGGFLTGVERNNYALVNAGGSVTATISPKNITPQYLGGTRVYDGSSSAPVASNTTGIFRDDSVAFGQTAVFSSGKNVGSGKGIEISGIVIAGADAANYRLTATTAAASGSITPKPITVTGLGAVAAQDRVYDGSSTVAVTVPIGVTLVPNSTDIVPGDQVAIAVPSAGTTTGTMLDKNVGTNKAVAITGLTLSGIDAGNYLVAGAAGVTVNIAAKGLTASYAGVSRVYDGGVLVSVFGTSADIVAGDLLGITGSGLFTGGGAKNVGTGKAISVTAANLSGADRLNYQLLNPTGSATGDVTPKTIVASYTAAGREYDGTANAQVQASRNGIVGVDAVTFSQTAVFSTGKNVGSNKNISITGIALGGEDAPNYQLASSSTSTTGSITQRPITLTGLTGVEAVNRAYDGSTTVAINLLTTGTVTPAPGAVLPGDNVTVSVPGGNTTTGTVADKNAGSNKAVLTIAGLGLAGSDAGNYSLLGASGLTVNIAQKALTASYNALSRVYDGTANAMVTGSSADIVFGDAIGITGSGLFTGAGAKNVGSGKAIDVLSAALSGADAGNYRLLNSTGGSTGEITPKTVTVSYSGGTRVYDGTLAAPVTATIAGLVSGDSLVASASAVFADKNVGTDKTVSIGSTLLAGSDLGNYLLGGASSSTTASITPKALRIDGLNGIAAIDRAYDGTKLVALTVTTTGTVTPNSEDLIAGDVVTLTLPGAGSTTGSMVDKNVGQAKAVTVTGLELQGADAANYRIAATGGVTVNITPKALTAVYVGVTKTYDGSTNASVTGSSSDIVAGDVIGIAGSGRYTGTGAKNAGSDKLIEVLGAELSGTDATNYSFVNPTGSASGTVLQRSVSASYIGGSRVYDGGTSAPVTGALLGFVAGDRVAVNGSAVFTGNGARNVGSGKAVTVSGIALSGDDAGNYALLGTTVLTTASITPKPLRIEGLTGVSAVDRVYDGTTTVSVAVQTSGALQPNFADVIAGDIVTVSLPEGGVSAGTMYDKNAGQGKAVTVAGLALGGVDGGNYTVAATVGLTVNIAAKSLTASYVGIDRIYDGTARADVGGSSADIVGGDLVSIGATGLFSSGKNVGSGKTVLVSNGLLSGADSGNYTLLNTSASVAASITPKLLTVAYTGGSRVYDGTLTAPVVADTTGFIAGDSYTLTQTALFSGADGKNAATGKAVAITGIALVGDDAANYRLLSSSAFTTATVTPRALNVTGLSGLAAVDREYDGTRNVQLVGSGLVGSASGDVLPGDVVTIGLPGGGVSAGLMNDKSAGQNKAVVVSGLTLTGVDAPNYTITGTAGLSVNIAPRAVTLLGVKAVDRVYDGSTAVAIDTTGGSIVGKIAGDALTLPGSGVVGSMLDRHAGSGKAVTVSGLSLAGADAANYVASGASGLTVTIARRGLLATATAADKVYDGGTTASVTLADDRIAGDSITLASGSARYADKNAGSGKVVSVAGITLAGTDAADYTLLADTATASASITRRRLTATLGGGDKVYDGSTAASATLQDDRIAGDTLLLQAAAARFDSKDAGRDKRTSVDGITLAGADAGNYELASASASGSASIARADARISGPTLSKVYGDSLDLGAAGFATAGLVAGETIGFVSLASNGSVATAGVAGGPYAVAASGASGGSFNPLNYNLSYVDGSLLVTPRPLTVIAGSLSKVYGEVVNLPGNAFTASGLANGETIGSVTLASLGNTTRATVGNGPYELSVSEARGGSFNPANYALSYNSGSLLVTPRPLVITGNSVQRYADQPNPDRFGYSINVGGLVGGDTLASVLLTAPAGSVGAPGGSIFELLPSGASFGSGEAGNYSLRYASGLLVVLPAPPRTSDADPGTGGGGGLAIEIDQAEIERALAALERTVALTGDIERPGSPALPPALRKVEASAADISVALAGDSRRISLPALLKLPLISFDPVLRRLIFGSAPSNPR